MVTPAADTWDRVRQAFADQFEQAGTSFVYRRSKKGAAISVSAQERQKFVDAFERSIGHAKWILYSGLTVAFGAVIGFSLLEDFDVSRGAMLLAIGLVTIPYFAYHRWAWGAPARELRGRTPVAGERPPEEVRRLNLKGVTYGQLTIAAVVGLAIPFMASDGHNVFSGWYRLWLVFGAAIILLAAVQAFRKWQVGREDMYKNVVPSWPGQNSQTRPQESESTEPAKSILWRYLPLAAILLGLAFIAYTPVGKQLSNQPSFWPILMVAFGGWALFTVAQGFTKGRIEPLTRGFYDSYQRETQPKRFWASMGWNALLGCLCLWLAYAASRDADVRSVEDRCYNDGDRLPPREAIAACSQLIEANHSGGYLSRADLFLDRGLGYASLDDRKHAIADYTAALRLEPNYPEAYLDRGYAYANLGQVEQALDDYAAAIRLRPTYAQAYLNRGLVFLDTGKLDSAIADFTRAHELDPNNEWALANRGIAYASKRDPVLAEKDFQAVRAVNPSNAVLLRGEALLDMNAGDMRSAVAEFTDALYQDPDNAWSLRMRAEAYRQLGDYDKSQADSRRAAELSNEAMPIVAINKPPTPAK